jgi:hypothetical protein
MYTEDERTKFVAFGAIESYEIIPVHVLWDIGLALLVIPFANKCKAF